MLLLAVASTLLQGDSLDLEQLRTNIMNAKYSLCEADVIGKSRGCSVEERASRNLLTSRLELSLNRCYVAKSSIAAAGNGIFAGRNIAAGELVTLYPGDGLRIGEEATLWTVQASDGTLGEPDASLLDRGKDYEREVEAHGSVSLMGDPCLVDDPAYLGHMINDGVTCTREALRNAYLAESSLVCNVHQVCLHGCHVAILATRDILQDEELFMAYGARYWTSRFSSTGADYNGRLLEDYWSEEELLEHRQQQRGRRSSRRNLDHGRDRDEDDGQQHRSRSRRSSKRDHRR